MNFCFACRGNSSKSESLEWPELEKKSLCDRFYGHEVGWILAHYIPTQIPTYLWSPPPSEINLIWVKRQSASWPSSSSCCIPMIWKAKVITFFLDGCLILKPVTQSAVIRCYAPWVKMKENCWVKINSIISKKNLIVPFHSFRLLENVFCIKTLGFERKGFKSTFALNCYYSLKAGIIFFLFVCQFCSAN